MLQVRSCIKKCKSSTQQSQKFPKSLFFLRFNMKSLLPRMGRCNSDTSLSVYNEGVFLYLGIFQKIDVFLGTLSKLSHVKKNQMLLSSTSGDICYSFLIFSLWNGIVFWANQPNQRSTCLIICTVGYWKQLRNSEFIDASINTFIYLFIHLTKIYSVPTVCQAQGWLLRSQIL